MTTRKDLVALAKASTLPGTRELMGAIDEAHGQLNLATLQLASRAHMAVSAKDECTYQPSGSFMKEATDYEIAAAKLNTLFLTLAIVLQNGGVEIDY